MKGCPYLTTDYYGDADCSLYAPFECDSCKFGKGRKNPIAKKYWGKDAVAARIEGAHELMFRIEDITP